MDTSRRSLVPALERSLAILEVLAQSKGGLTLSQLTRYLNLPKSSVYCLLRTFEENGYLFKQTSSGKYRLTTRLSDLARCALNGMSLREKARPFLKSLSEQTGIAVHLAVVERGSCVLIEKLNPAGSYRCATWVGKQVSLHCTAIGKALAAWLPETVVERIVSEHGLMRYNDNTICSFRKLKEDLALVRERGYSLDDEEEEIGVRCLGAPIFNGNNEAIAAVSIVGTTTQIHADRFNELVSYVTGTARRITQELRGESLEPGDVVPSWNLPSLVDTLPCKVLHAVKLSRAVRTGHSAA